MLTAETTRVHLLDTPHSLFQAVIAGRRSVAVLFDAGHDGGPGLGERVFVRCGAGRPSLVARVGRTDRFEEMVPSQIDALRETFAERAILTDAAWEEARWARSAVVVWLEQVRPLAAGVNVPVEFGGAGRPGWRSVRAGGDGRLAA